MTATEILKQLVSFSVLGGEPNDSIADWIEDYLTSHEVVFKNVHNDERTKRSIHCRIGPDASGGIILSGHMDVVPVAGQDWSTDPFVLTDKQDGKLYARGSCDMKGFIACCLAALPDMLKADLATPIYFAFSYDEEIGCLAGDALAADIRDHYDHPPKFAIIGEPSMMQPIVGQKGIVIFKTSVNGSAGHSSRIRQEVSAIHESARLITWLENKMYQLIESSGLDERFDPPHTSIHIGVFDHSGIAPNVISDHASFFWDVRVIPRDSSKEILNDFRAYCDELIAEKKNIFPNFNIETSYAHPDVPPLDTPDHLSIVPWIKQMADRPDVGTVSYAAEAGQFSLAGFETVICGPGDIAQAHRANEFVSKDQLLLCAAMLDRIINHCQ